MDKYIIGLDNGGTVGKAALFDLLGHEIAVVTRKTTLITPQPGYAERDMEALWVSNCECIKELITKNDIKPADILGIAVCGHGKGLYPWGKHGKPACNGIVSIDNRAWQYPEKWRREGTAQALYAQLCQDLIPCQQASLLAWMKDHSRETYDDIQWVFSVKDYIRFRLTGEAYSEASDISGSGLMDVKNVRFDRELLKALGIGEVYEKLAPLRYSSDNCGCITAEAARLTGLAQGTPVAGGMFDIDACAIAMDITSPDQLCTITGTWSINEFIAKAPILGTSVAMNSLYAIPGYYLLEECSATSAGNLEWFIENTMENEKARFGKNLYGHISNLVASIDPSECEVYYLPFLYGSNAHPLAKGSLIGLTSFHTKAHMLRAIYEGVAFSHKSHIDKLLSVRNSPKAIRMAGGAANSPLWVQMFADILGLPIETVQGVTELGALGAAMSLAVAIGIYQSYSEASKVMVRVNAPIMPDKSKNEIYGKKYKKYQALVDSLNMVWDMFSV
jgi:L-xylulokinase